MTSKDITGPQITPELWVECVGILERFLEGDNNYLYLGDSTVEELLHVNHAKFSDKIDLVQFNTLKIFEKGELGIRELHWILSNYIASSRLLRLVFFIIPFKRHNFVRHSLMRFQHMQKRRTVIAGLLGDFGVLGIAIPSYIEPRVSSFLLSRKFVSALLEFNSGGYLTLQRACFALARSSSYYCIRISGFGR